MLNFAEQRWELLGSDGETVHGWMTTEFLVRAAPISRTVMARRGWPELTPGVPWIHCVFADGPLAGRHEYLDPMAYDAPAPEQLTVAWGLPEPGLRHGREFTAVYRLQVQGCGHGRACAYPYRWDRELW